MAPAVRLARLGLVILGAARVWVVAAGLPPAPLQLPGDGNCLGVLVQPLPAESNGLALAGTDCQRQHEPDAVAAIQGGCEQAVDLLDLERLDLVLLDARRLRQLGWVPSDVAA